MKLIPWSFALAVVGLATPAAATDEPMKRVFTCKGDDAAMEVYIPQSAVEGAGPTNVKVNGAYTLDLTSAGKGKNLEPVHVSLSPDQKFVIVDQFIRGLPPTRIPVSGGTVNFDNRFGTNAQCGAFNEE